MRPSGEGRVTYRYTHFTKINIKGIDKPLLFTRAVFSDFRPYFCYTSIEMKQGQAKDCNGYEELQEKQKTPGGYESFSYGENLRSIMEHPVYTCSPGDITKDIVKDMSEKGVSSVVVVNENQEPVGILTERDVLKRIVAAGGVDITRVPISAVMTPKPVTLSPDDTIYRALSVLSNSGIKHLLLVEEGKLAGILTLRQVLKLRYPDPMVAIGRIAEASDILTLKEIKAELPMMAASKLRMGVRAREVVTMLSLINEDIHRKTMELAIRETGDPPLQFCLFVTGSHGRMENHLTSDQDHGMVIEDSGTAEHDPYFIALTKTYSDWLTEIGYAFCPGYIMSMNPLWRKELSEWKAQINYWFERQVPHLVRYLTLLYDARPVYGNEMLFKEMSDYAYGLLGTHHEVLRVLLEEESGHRIPVNFLGRFITEKRGPHWKELDIKRSGLIFVVEAVRILALRRGIRKTSTIARIRSLVAAGFINADDGENYEAAYHILLHYTIKAQAEKAVAGKEPDTFINPKKLTSRERMMLKLALGAVSGLQDLVASEFGQLAV